MLETNGYNLSSQQRAVIDYMRSVYQIDDIKVRAGGKHLHVEYVYAGRRHKDTFPRGRGLDPNWVDTRKHDLRKELGSPPADPPQPTKRKLDDMTQEVQARADLLGSTAAGAVIHPKAKATIATGKTATAPPPVPHQHYGCTIGTLKNSTNIAFYLGLELYAAMELQFGKGRRYVFSYHHPNTWTARPSRDAGQIIDPANHRLRCAGAEAIKRLGMFASTKAEAIIHHNRVEFRMALPTVVVKPQVFVESIETVEAPPEPATVAVPVAVVTAPMSPAELVPFVAGKPVQVVGAPPAPPPASPTNPADRLRHVLRQIKQIEEEGTYQLINSNGWRWRAADIGLED
jgi:hypothetical protein